MTGPALLARYLEQHELTYAAFALRVSADRARVQRCATGDRGPGLALALAIQRETGGAVPASSWIAVPSKPTPAVARKVASRGGVVRRAARGLPRKAPRRSA